MSIRLKIVLVVLPIIIVTLVLTGASSFFAATTGITRVAREFLGFKAYELEKYADSQWALLVENNFTGRPEMVKATEGGVETFARSIVRSRTELILAVNEAGEVMMKTGDFELKPDEKPALVELVKARTALLVTRRLGGTERVAQGFWFEPFKWYLLVTEEKKTFYSDIDQITVQTGIILGASSLAAVIMLLMFAGYLTRPLTRVVGTMRTIISSNDLTARVSVEYHDEIGQLSHTFNIMIGELQRAYSQIKKHAFEAVLSKKKEQRIRQIFQLYVPQEIIDQCFSNPEAMLVGDDRVVPILFSDIRGFTTISEGMRPDDLVNTLNRYFSIMVDIIMNRNGVVDKYIGDAIMAFWGTPVKREDDALQSVLAGLEMISGLEEFNRYQRENGKKEWNTGIGINYGNVTVGNIGSERKMNYTVIGDMVNLASRLEGLTKKYHQSMLISESLHMKVKDALPCRLVDSVAVKGKTRGVKIYTACKELNGLEKKAWTLHNDAMEMYYNRRFREAGAQFRRVIELMPGDYTAQMFVERCAEYDKAPPPRNWDGVEIMHEK
jgi:adenylate cyclase